MHLKTDVLPLLLLLALIHLQCYLSCFITNNTYTIPHYVIYRRSVNADDRRQIKANTQKLSSELTWFPPRTERPFIKALNCQKFSHCSAVLNA